MKKVVYSVTRDGKNELTKMTGIGYITDKDLIIACVGKNGKPYIRVFEDCLKEIRPIHTRPNAYKGYYTEFRKVEFEKNGSYETREIELEYNIWYKLADK
mgnify:CR=1 FL=1